MSVKPQITHNQITHNQLKQIIQQDKHVIAIKNKLENISSKISLIWNLLLQASEYIETFDSINQGNMILLEKLEKENTRLYKKYKEYGDQYDDLEDDLDDTISAITKKYNIIQLNSASYMMRIAPSARGIKRTSKLERKAKIRHKAKKNTRQNKNKSKGKKKMWYEKLFV